MPQDATSEYLKILSLVEHHNDFNKLRSLKHETNEDLNKLKDRLSRFMVYGRPSQVSKFIEYWVPVQISNLQLEHYCDTLLSHSNTLCSYSRKDPFGVLPEILLTVRKVCSVVSIWFHCYIFTALSFRRVFRHTMEKLLRHVSCASPYACF